MKTQLRFEELGMFILGVLLFTTLEYSWWVFLLLIPAPDISMAGYLLNKRMGAALYNFFHHKGIAVAVYLSGRLLAVSPLMLAGIILFAHASIDRIFGYGLKYPDAFTHTHLGWIGKDTAANKGHQPINH